MKNIRILPTDKPSRLVNYLMDNSWDLFSNPMPKVKYVVCQNIYITNSDEIKANDFYIHNKSVVQSAGGEVEKGDYKNCQKIILTTDEELIVDGVQAIDDEFLEWFVKNPTCEGVEYNKNYNRGNGKDYYKIIIPKEHKLIHQQIIDAVGGEDRFRKICKIELKQDSLEEAAERYKNLKLPDDLYDGFIAGYKLRQERSYSEVELFINEVKDKIDSFEYSVNQNSYISEYLDEWFEQFKKK